MADEKANSSEASERRRSPDPTARSSDGEQLDPRWFLYPAYFLTFSAGGIAINFAAQSREWATFPVALAWGLLFLWYWLYGVAFRYRRPVLKYFSLAGALGIGGLLTAFCLERVPSQIVAAEQGAEVRGLVMELAWAGLITGTSAFVIGLHAILFGRARGT